jgi:inorganic pyrophosphatase
MFLHQLPAGRSEDEINVVIEVPKGSDGKFKYDPKTGFFELHGSLPKGLLFPYDYGFIPSTLGEDGDPLDVVALVDPTLFCGCLVSASLIGLIKGTQKAEKGERRVRNDILLAVHAESVTWKGVSRLSKLPSELLDQIEFFFAAYRTFQGKEFRPIARLGPREAKKVLREGATRWRKSLGRPKPT